MSLFKSMKARVISEGVTLPVVSVNFFEDEVVLKRLDGEGEYVTLELNDVELIADGSMSDGYHTFNELYFHRMTLFAIVCNQNKHVAWKSKLHHDGTMYPNYFVAGIDTPIGQYTYHYNIADWDNFNVKELKRAPEFDGHRPDDISRLLTLIQGDSRVGPEISFGSVEDEYVNSDFTIPILNNAAEKIDFGDLRRNYDLYYYCAYVEIPSSEGGESEKWIVALDQSRNDTEFQMREALEVVSKYEDRDLRDYTSEYLDQGGKVYKIH